MENLSLEEGPPPGGPAIGSAPLGPDIPSPQNQQLPPQMFTTAAQLLDMTDKKLLVCLRDGRKLIGVLRSWDQFANLVLQQTVERIFVPPNSSSASSKTAPTQPGLYADIRHGIFLVRGENVLLLGEIDLDKDDDEPPGYEMAEVELVQKLAKERRLADARKEKNRLRRLGEFGFEGENAGEVLLG